jgi:hypothetical protein
MHTQPPNPHARRLSHAPSVRPVVAGDLPALKAVVDATGLFPSALLDGMAAGYLAGRTPATPGSPTPTAAGRRPSRTTPRSP